MVGLGLTDGLSLAQALVQIFRSKEIQSSTYGVNLANNVVSRDTTSRKFNVDPLEVCFEFHESFQCGPGTLGLFRVSRSISTGSDEKMPHGPRGSMENNVGAILLKHRMGVE